MILYVNLNFNNKKIIPVFIVIHLYPMTMITVWNLCHVMDKKQTRQERVSLSPARLSIESVYSIMLFWRLSALEMW